MSDIGGNL